MNKIIIILITLITFTFGQTDILVPNPTPEDNPAFYTSCEESVVNKTGNPFCKCKPNPTMRYLNSKFLVSPVCLPTTVTSRAGGGILGNIGGRVLWTYKGENTNTGAPLEIETAVIDNNRIVVTWAEDQGGYTFSKTAVRTHVTEIDISGAPRITRDVVLMGCVMNGGVVYNKNNGNIVTLCAKYCTNCPAGALDLRIVEVSLSTFQKVQDYSIMLPECIPNNQYCFQAVSGTAFRYLKHDPVNDRYAVSHNAGWGTHVADSVVIVDAKTRTIITQPGFGYRWACGGGHTAGMKIAYSPNTPGGFVQLCTTDIDTVGMIYSTLIPKKVISAVAPQRIWQPQASITWPGSLVSCGNYVYAAWHGVKKAGLPKYNESAVETGDASIDIGFARINAATGAVEKLVWMTNANGKRNKMAKIAPLSSSCSAFLFGWGEGETTELYPTRYYLTEVDMNGNKLTPVQRVDEFSIWYDDTEWVTLANGGVVWTTSWRRLKTTGAPRHMPLEFDGWMNTRMKLATYAGHGYGFFFDPNNIVNERFKTNELFVSIYKQTPMTAGTLYVPPTVAPVPSNYCRIIGNNRYYYTEVLHYYKTFRCVNNTWTDVGKLGGFGMGKCRDDTSGKIQFYAPWMDHTLGDKSVKRCGNGGYDYTWGATISTAPPKVVTTLSLEEDSLELDD